ncbi:MAG: VCBS repeat-containing protein, partial [Chitinophagales bacterium]
MTKFPKNRDTSGSRHFKNACYLSVIWIIMLNSCETKTPLFKKLDANHTGIHFKNEITEDSIHNILNFTNLYTGSGVGIADFNKDGLPDIFLGGNMESSRLYLNKGGLQFEDITQKAGIETDRWVTGVAIADVNGDTWQDIYLSVSGNASAEKRKNLLFINQQNNTFREEAEKYGIADTAQCTHANFLDYDKDGDLDFFVIINPTDYKLFNVNNIRKKKVKGESPSTDKLYRNNGDGTFSDVSETSGILIEGYSLSLNVSDLNNDGWSDIYITNDFLTNDILYINNQDGTFTNRAAEMLKHQSFASMGVDVADINNDGQPEIYVLDMFPEDNYRQKMIMGSDNYDRFQYMLKTGYEPQYSRNTLQLNNGDGTFSEIGQLANVHKTDWSWSALLADYDNDGFRDLFITNGFRRDLGDLDYINYNNTNPFGDPESRKKDHLKRILEQPGAQLPNYVFKNENGLTFSKKSKEWGIDELSYSHGAAFADLDLDGDLDLVVNNVSQTAFVYENQSDVLQKNNFLKIELKANRPLIGTKVWIYFNGGKLQFAEYTPYRGYQSTVENGLHFGLGEAIEVDSVKVVWTDGSVSRLEEVAANQVLKVEKEKTQEGKEKVKSSVGTEEGVIFSDIEAKSKMKDYTFSFPQRCHLSFFHASTKGFHLQYLHKEDQQVDFKSQFLLPHQHSKIGPPIAVGDVNGDGWEDFFIGGAAGFSGVFFLQNEGETFSQQLLNQDIEKEDTDCAFLDVDGDGDLDLYVVSGGVVFTSKTEIYQDRVYINEGGVFTKNENALPSMLTSGGCMAAEDLDGDGVLDVFIGGGVVPKEYPTLPRSYLLENQNGTFKDITPKSLSEIGMVTAAIWTDYDQDGDKDLMLVGEFMPIVVFENKQGQLSNHQSRVTNHSSGWWNSLVEGDFDGDGDMDYLAGNLGLNTNFRASVEEPVCVYANDFDKNGSLDPVLCQYIEGKEYPLPSRDKLIAQIPPIKVRFNDYKSYAEATFSELFKSPEKKGMLVLKAETFESAYIENLGDGEFALKALPLKMQLAPLNDFLVEDFNGDGHLDALVIGNSYATEVGIGRYDAFTGALMLGDGAGDFEVLRGAECGFLADKDAKSLVRVELKGGAFLYLVGN